MRFERWNIVKGVKLFLGCSKYSESYSGAINAVRDICKRIKMETDYLRNMKHNVPIIIIGNVKLIIYTYGTELSKVPQQSAMLANRIHTGRAISILHERKIKLMIADQVTSNHHHNSSPLKKNEQVLRTC